MPSSLLKYVCILCIGMQICARENNVRGKVRAGYFYLTSELAQKRYRHGGPDFEIEAAGRFYEDITLWFNFNVFRRDSKALGFCDPESLHVYPLSAGCMYNFLSQSILSPYLGIGISYSFVKIQPAPTDTQQATHYNNFGVVGKSGILFGITEESFIDLFADYYYTRACSAAKNTGPNVGGIRLGIGIGFNY